MEIMIKDEKVQMKKSIKVKRYNGNRFRRCKSVLEYKYNVGPLNHYTIRPLCLFF
jgi:hypothetical protein